MKIDLQNEKIIALEQATTSSVNDASLYINNSSITKNKNNAKFSNGNNLFDYVVPSNTKQAVVYIFDLQGGLIKKYNVLEKGIDNIILSKNEFKSGMYIYSLIIDGKEEVRKKIIIDFEVVDTSAKK